jgi:hypothetical protein
MTRKRWLAPAGRSRWLWAGATMLATFWVGTPGRAQAPSSAPASAAAAATVAAATTAADAAPAAASPADTKTTVDPAVKQVGCSTCSNGVFGGSLGGGYSGGCSTCGSGGCAAGCYPGTKPCDCCCNAETPVGRFICGVYQCVCCPDPCYEPPHWLGVADAAFFVDATRPITQSRVRYDAGFDMNHPDRGEYFWAREQIMPNQLGPGGPCAPTNKPGTGPGCIARATDFEQLSLYTEAASGGFGAFFEIPYREIDPESSGLNSQLGLNPCCQHSGFADMNAGFKSLLLDCELVQIGFQFTTYIPIGDVGKGLGTGHVSLEPALLYTIKLGPKTYLQGESAYWIPIAGDPLYESNIWRNHISFNHILWRPCCDIQLLGTIEINEWSIFQGSYTATDFLIPNPANGKLSAFAASATDTIVSAGPGIRLVVCDKFDVGVGTAFSITGERWAEELIRTEFRLRF